MAWNDELKREVEQDSVSLGSMDLSSDAFNKTVNNISVLTKAINEADKNAIELERIALEREKLQMEVESQARVEEQKAKTEFKRTVVSILVPIGASIAYGLLEFGGRMISTMYSDSFDRDNLRTNLSAKTNIREWLNFKFMKR